MAILSASYTQTGRSISTEHDPHGSTLLGALPGLAARAALAQEILDHVTVTSTLVDVVLKDGSHLYLQGSFEGGGSTLYSMASVYETITGTITQIAEVEAASPKAPRYVLSEISLSIKDYFSTATWSDVLQGNDTLRGGVGDDELIDYAGHSVFEGMGGNDKLAGFSDDHNLAVYRGKLSDYQITKVSGINYDNVTGASGYSVNDTVSGRDGRDTLVNIERLKFSDTKLALDVGQNENAGAIYRLYEAAFDRAPKPVGEGYWLKKLDNGETLTDIANQFALTDEFRATYGGSNPDYRYYVTKLFEHVLGRQPKQAGLDYWSAKLEHGESYGSVLAGISESNENVANVAKLIANGIQYTDGS